MFRNILRKEESRTHNMSDEYDSTHGGILDDGKISVPASEVERSEKIPLRDGVEYDPYLHRNVKHPTTYDLQRQTFGCRNGETLFHLVKGSLGTGILAMPKAFVNAGYLVGGIGSLAISVICTYCIHLLVKAEYELCKRKRVTE